MKSWMLISYDLEFSAIFEKKLIDWCLTFRESVVFLSSRVEISTNFFVLINSLSLTVRSCQVPFFGTLFLYVFTQSRVSLMAHWCLVSWILTRSFPFSPLSFLMHSLQVFLERMQVDSDV
jgi:hypothetical protein